MVAILTRRAFISVSAAGLASPATGCSYDQDAYRRAVADMTRPLPPNPELRDLVRYATLAANGHNTQPWRFRAHNRSIDILPDFSRRTPAVDPDDHHLFASLGCAAENLSLAAAARGMSGAVLFDPAGEGRAQVDLGPAASRQSDLLAAIPARQCSRAVYDGAEAPAEVLRRLVSAANNYGVEALFVTDEKRTEDILALVIEGNSRQIDDPAFVAELKDWVRFNPDSAVATLDGLYSASSGNPTMPRWVGATLFDLFFTKKSENDKYSEQIRSSAGIVVFVAETNDREGWFNAGRAYQRFALQATVDGLKNAFINQAVEVPEMRGVLAGLLETGGRRPNLVVRFGNGPLMPKSLRRNASDVIV